MYYYWCKSTNMLQYYWCLIDEDIGFSENMFETFFIIGH